jgi:hypothetical protein
MGLVWGVSQQNLVGPGKNLTFVGSYKLPLSQYTCIGRVVACNFQQAHSMGCGVTTLKPSTLIISLNVGVMSMHLLGVLPRHRR